MKKFLILSLFFICSTVYSQPAWQEVFSGIPNNLKFVKFVNTSTGYVFGDGVYLATTNGGSTWQQNAFPYKVSDAELINATTIFVTGRSTNQHDTNVVLKSTNGGGNWSTYYIDNPSAYSTTQIKFINASTGFLFSRDYTYNQFRKTTNGGVTWYSIMIQGEQMYSIDARGSLVCGTGYRTTTSLYPYFVTSTNFGNSWQYSRTFENAPFLRGNDVFIVDNVTLYGTFGDYPYGQNLCKSINGGVNWTQLTTSPFTCNRMKFLNEFTGYYCYKSQNSVIGKTTNDGINWTKVQLTDTYINDVVLVNAQIGYAVADYGIVLKTTTGGMPIGIQQISSSIPDEYSLLQNYPNPFNPTTHIRFSMPQKDNMSLVVYDGIGREVKVLFEGTKEAGTYEVTFNATSLVSGVYFYRLRTSHFAETKRMVVAK